MTAPFVEVQFETDPEQDALDAFEEMGLQFPGWEASEAQLEVWLIRIIAFLKSDAVENAGDVPGEIFAAFGQKIVGIAIQEAVAASVESTWTMIDDAGYTIPAGTDVEIRGTGDTVFGFRVRDEVLVAPGSTATTEGEVILEAVEPGTEANDLSGDVSLIDSLSFVEDSGIALEAATAGGVDAELISDYLDRLADELTLLAPKPILPDDFAVFARRHPSVFRAVAIDGYDAVTPGAYDPDDPMTWTERMVSVAVVSESGTVLSSGIKNEVKADLEARREINFVAHVIDPTFTVIDVEFAIVPYAGFDPADVETSVIETLTSVLSPQNWGQSRTQPHQESPTSWLNETVLRYQDLSTLINNVQGVDYHTTLNFGESGSALGTSDLPLDGPAPLTQPGTIAVV